MSISGVQGELLEVTVVECTKLKDTQWFTRQHPYVCLEYGSTKFRTRTWTDEDKTPVFQEKFAFTRVKGLREINVVVWNKNYITYDDFMGSAKVQLADVLSRGYDDRTWPLQSKTGQYAGDVKLIMHYNQTNKPAPSYTPSAPPYTALPKPHLQSYSATNYPSAPLNYAYQAPMHYLSHTCPHTHAECSSLSYLPPPGPSYSPLSYHPPAALHAPPPGLYGMYSRPPYRNIS